MFDALSKKQALVSNEYPWPNPSLGPNEKSWRKKMNLTKKARSECCMITQRPFKPPPERTSFFTVIEFYPPHYRYDTINMLGYCKAMIDGMCDKLGINDRSLNPVYLEMKEKTKHGKVVITLYS